MKTKFFSCLLLLLSLVVTGNLRAADVTGALVNVADSTITYKSVDANNQEITLSAKLYYKTDQTVSFVLLNCHPTITHNNGCPTGDAPQMEAIKYMVSEGALVVCPDYLGFGETSDSIHPYMCSTLTARNVLDAYKAAIKYVKGQGRAISSDYYTINIGYSQGGATALAFQRYLETEATAEDRAFVNLAGSVCGAGPYSQQIVFDVYEKEMKSLDYPVYLLYVLQGHKEAFGQTSMRDLTLEECFTPEFWAKCQDTKNEEGYITKLNAKETNVDELNKLIKNDGFTTFEKIINADYAKRNSKLYRTIEKTLAHSNLLADGWTPIAPIIFYHDQAGNDIVVPYACTDAALKFVKDKDGKYSYVDAVDDYGYDVTFKYGIATRDKDNYLWHAAVFDEIWIDMWKYPLQKTVKGLAGLFSTQYSFNDLDHRTFGARFYAQFLAERECMRPNKKYADYFKDNVKGQGTASSATNIAPATPVNNQTLDLNAGATVAAGYDDVTLKFTNDLPLEKMSFVSFPVKVDGFWFGYDAPRYKVMLNGEGEVTGYTAMGNLDDFEAGELYLVEPKSHVNNNNVLAREAGVTLKTKEYLPEWIMLNHRPLNVFQGKSYATAYMPFAYKSDVAYTIADSSEGRVSATKVGDVVPAGNGVLLVAEKDVASCYLAPVVFEPSKLDNNILLGTYKGIPNDSYLTFGRNKADTSKVGFYKYTGSTIKAYSCYLESTNGASSRQIDFAEPTGIESVVESVATEVYSLDGKRQRGLTNGVNIMRSSNGMVKKVIK